MSLLWDARLAREVQTQARIEEAFDKADSYALDADFERALASLSEAEELSGGLPDGYLAQRKLWISLLAPLAVVAHPGADLGQVLDRAQ